MDLSGTMGTKMFENLFKTNLTVVPVMNGHPRDQAKVSVHCRWPLIRGNLTLKCVGRGIDNVAVQGRWPLTTGSPKAGTTVSHCTQFKSPP